MRKTMTAICLLMSFGVAHAESGKRQLFDCMDAKTFEMNSQCVANQISNTSAFRDAQTKITMAASESNAYVTATMKFYPRQMRIDIVAHKDALLSKLQSKALIAKK